MASEEWRDEKSGKAENGKAREREEGITVTSDQWSVKEGGSREEEG